jgi:hypothetical protein
MAEHYAAITASLAEALQHNMRPSHKNAKKLVHILRANEANADVVEACVTVVLSVVNELQGEANDTLSMSITNTWVSAGLPRVLCCVATRLSCRLQSRIALALAGIAAVNTFTARSVIASDGIEMAHALMVRVCHAEERAHRWGTTTAALMLLCKLLPYATESEIVRALQNGLHKHIVWLLRVRPFAPIWHYAMAVLRMLLCIMPEPQPFMASKWTLHSEAAVAVMATGFLGCVLYAAGTMSIEKFQDVHVNACHCLHAVVVASPETFRAAGGVVAVMALLPLTHDPQLCEAVFALLFTALHTDAVEMLKLLSDQNIVAAIVDVVASLDVNAPMSVVVVHARLLATLMSLPLFATHLRETRRASKALAKLAGFATRAAKLDVAMHAASSKRKPTPTPTPRLTATTYMRGVECGPETETKRELEAQAQAKPEPAADAELDSNSDPEPEYIDDSALMVRRAHNLTLHECVIACMNVLLFMPVVGLERDSTEHAAMKCIFHSRCLSVPLRVLTHDVYAQSAFLLKRAAVLLWSLLPIGGWAPDAAKGYRHLLEQLTSDGMQERLRKLEDGSCRIGPNVTPHDDLRAPHDDLRAPQEDVRSAREAIADLRQTARNMRDRDAVIEEIL